MREREPGRWELRVDAGRDPLTGRRRQRSKVVHGGRRHAERALAQMVAEVAAESTPGTEAPLSVLLERWLAQAERDLSPSTVAEYRRLADVRVIPAIGDMPLHRLTSGHLDGLYVALAADLSPASIQRVHALIRRALAQALRWGWVERNVALAASPPTVPARTMDLPPVAVLPRLLAAAHAHDEAVGVAVELAARTGMRRGEVCGLQWRDVLPGEVWVRRSVLDLSGHLTTKGTKTGRERRLTIDAVLSGVLVDRRRFVDARARECGVKVADDAYVASRAPDGSVPLRPEALSKAWAKVCAGAKVEGLRLHDLRHLHATVLIDAGVPVTTVAARLGHARMSTTLDVYAHAVRASDGIAADAFLDALGAGDEDAADGADGPGGGGPGDGGVGALGGEVERPGEGDEGEQP